MAPNNNFSWTQYFPPKPRYTIEDIPVSLQGKVYIVTGANSGMGKELAQVLYAKGAKVYVACRSEEKASQAINEIKQAEQKQSSKGDLIALSLDLSDLRKVQAAAKIFLAKESKLYVLFNNTGVMVGDNNNKDLTPQGYKEALWVATAKSDSEPAGSVRVVWLSSFGLEHFAPEGRGVDLDNLDHHTPKIPIERYGMSKAGTWLLAVEYTRRYKDVVSVAINPGNIKTNRARHQGIALKLIAGAIVYPVINGVYTQLFAAFSPEVTTQVDWTKNWIIPFGRIAAFRPDLTKATLPVEEGGNGNAQQFLEWHEQQVKDYLQ
ncbi:Uu.00g124760.m01.CDS01 [Anthostomella pinea]|uniref:Uu.00g124760.m01.CDS01 n=1 Tax=Anthostomella pinea TaxID=933095 RepID=A0AAI8VHN7_9PEZI|nr:Uu.00g124760.m01.CDS01 [Anthostomella pinea]